MENFKCRVVIGDVLCIKKNRGGCKVVIEVIGRVKGEVMTRTSELRKMRAQIKQKPTTTEGQGHWI